MGGGEGLSILKKIIKQGGQKKTGGKQIEKGGVGRIINGLVKSTFQK